jgi:hypothetical protein
MDALVDPVDGGSGLAIIPSQSLQPPQQISGNLYDNVTVADGGRAVMGNVHGDYHHHVHHHHVQHSEGRRHERRT